MGLLSARLSLGSQDPIRWLKELLSHSAPDSSLVTTPLMPELRVLPLEWAPSTLPTRSSTRAPGAAPGTTIGEPTTGFLVDRLFKMEPLDFWPVLLGPHLSIMPRE